MNTVVESGRVSILLKHKGPGHAPGPLNSIRF